MSIITVETDNTAFAKKLATFLKTIDSVKSVVVENPLGKSLTPKDWVRSGRPATDEEVDTIVSTSEAEIESGKGIPSDLARKQTLEHIKKWREHKNRK